MKFLRDPIERGGGDDPSKSALGCLLILALIVLAWQVWELAHGHGMTALPRQSKTVRLLHLLHIMGIMALKEQYGMPLLKTTSPSQEDMVLAAQASRSLANGEIEYSKLPADVIHIIQVALSEMSEGRTVSIKPVKREISTFEAARYLNVSRPYVIKLLDEGKMSCRRVGAHRRIPFEEVKAYREIQDEAAYAAMAELQALAQEEQSDP